MDSKFKSLLRGPGFYAAMALCAAAVVLGGCLLLARQEPEAPVRQEVPAAGAVEDLPAEEPEKQAEPAVQTPPEEDPVPVVSMPEEPVIPDDTPVAAEAPLAVVSPLQGEVVAAFSVDALVYDATMDDWRTHDGVDIAAAEGEAVLAACAGTVLSVDDDPLMGTTVVLGHSGGYRSVYASLQAGPPVAEGEAVSAGQVIGAVGAAAPAEAAQGPHLHFSVTRDGEPVDPAAFLGQ